MSQVSGLFCFISISIYNCNNYQHVLTLLQIQKIYLFGTNGKTDFYDLWQQHKQLKTMEMSDAWLYVFYELYIHQLQQILLTKFTTTSRSTKFKDILLLNNSHYHEDQPNQHENSQKLCNEMGHPVVNWMESPWKLRQHDQNLPIEEKPLQN